MAAAGGAEDLGPVVQVGFDEAVLCIWVGVVALGAAGVGRRRVVVVVGPFGKVIGELKAGQIGGGVFEVDDDELLVLVLGLKEGRLLVIWANTKDVSVLGLCMREQTRE